MKKQFLLLVLLSSMQSVAIAEWVKYGSNPVIAGPEPIGTPVVLEINGSYRMWYQSQPTYGQWDISYATSTDALHWTPQGVVFGNGSQLALGTVRYDNSAGSFQMWYSWGGVSGQTGYASSNDGVNNWQDRGLVLDHGSGGAYDGYVAAARSVLYDESESLYKMWYTAKADVAAPARIAYATSSNGFNWDKLEHEVFSEKANTWYSARVSDPFVEKSAAGYTMWFSGDNGAYAPIIGHVHSVDGVNWDYDTVQIDLEHGIAGSWDDTTLRNPWLLRTSSEQSFLYYAGSRVRDDVANTDGIGVATPEPATLLLLGLGGLALLRKRRA